MIEWVRQTNAKISYDIGKIEIVNHANQLEIVYFPIPDMIRKYTVRKQVLIMEDEIMENLPIQSAEVKVTAVNASYSTMVTFMRIMNDIE